MNKKGIFDKDKIALVPDHFTPNKDIKSAEHCKCLREFAMDNHIPNYFEIGEMGIEHALLPEKGLVVAGDVVIGADSHTCTYGALGAFSTGVGSTDMAAGMVTGKAWFKVPAALKFVLTGMPKKWVSGKDIILHIIGMIGILHKTCSNSGIQVFCESPGYVGGRHPISIFNLCGHSCLFSKLRIICYDAFLISREAMIRLHGSGSHSKVFPKILAVIRYIGDPCEVITLDLQVISRIFYQNIFPNNRIYGFAVPIVAGQFKILISCFPESSFHLIDKPVDCCFSVFHRHMEHLFFALNAGWIVNI